MSYRRSRTAFLVGGLIAVPLAATNLVLVLKRIFPDSIAVNFIGPVLCVLGVLLLVMYLRRER
jgi:hypothetical protein